MKKYFNTKLLATGFVVASLLLLSGCEGLKNMFGGGSKSKSHSSKSASKSGKALLKINGKVAITDTEFEDYLDKIAQMNPQLKPILQAMPAMKHNIFTGMMGNKLVEEWAEKHGIKDSEKFQQEYEMTLEMIEQELLRKYFQEQLVKNIKISDAEAKNFYEEHKDKEQAFKVGEKDGKVEYRPFDQVKDQIKQHLTQQKLQEVMQTEMEKLKGLYNVEEDKDYFKTEEAPSPVAQAMDEIAHDEAAPSVQEDKKA